MKQKIYLDNAATTALDPTVLETMMPFFTEFYGNPSSIHTFGRKTKSAIENARKLIANLLHTSPGEIFFTSGGTEADNMAIIQSVETLGVQHVVSSKVEHHAVLHTLDYLEKAGKITVTYLENDDQGILDIDSLAEILARSPKTLVSLMHGNNEIGNLLDLKKVGEICKVQGALFHSDTVQTMGHYAFNLQEIPMNFLVGAAHKFHGPKGVGFLYINAENKINPILHGGSQERNMRGGTENLYAIVGMAKALELALSEQESHQKHIVSLKKALKDKLETNIPGVTFNGLSGELDKSLYTVLNVRFPAHKDNEMMLFNLDIEGIACSGGSACSSGTDVGSHVLNCLNIDSQTANIRFSFSRFTTLEEVERAADTIIRIVKA
jgi:cysteine desulfurase